MEVDAPVGISFAHRFWRIPTIIPIHYFPGTFCHPRGCELVGKETMSKEKSNAELETVLDRIHARNCIFVYFVQFLDLYNILGRFCSLIVIIFAEILSSFVI